MPTDLYLDTARFGLMAASAQSADADFVLVDLAARYRLDQATLHSKHPVTPFHGWELVGRPVATYLRGVCAVREGEAQGSPRGRFLRPAGDGEPR